MAKCGTDSWRSTLACLLLPIAFLAEDPDGHHMMGVVRSTGWSEDAFSREFYEPYDDSFVQRLSTGFLHGIDDLLFGERHDERVTIATAVRQVLAYEPCASEVDTDPWRPLGANAMNAWLLGYVDAWCRSERTRLRVRVADGAMTAFALQEWDHVCNVTVVDDDRTWTQQARDFGARLGLLR